MSGDRPDAKAYEFICTVRMIVEAETFAHAEDRVSRDLEDVAYEVISVEEVR